MILDNDPQFKFWEQNVINPEPEIRRLLDIMPASGRMAAKIVSKPQQPQVISYRTSLPWAGQPISINFDLWSQLSRPKRDLLLLRAVGWFKVSSWFKPDVYQALMAAGLLGAVVEFVQLDTVGVAVSGGLGAIAGLQIWRNSRGTKIELAADQEAIRVAQRRGYSEADAAQQLLWAIQAVATLENCPNLDFDQLIRCQNLRAIAGLSTENVPETLK
ncbi:MAG: DUF3318 domain-containing protein [Aphanocapsa sp. GSE-SYN-MK-11-07L]|nr:DUF3318 domain-containing protein [Aphanocapsa sp. GSE-SYN-MK-11-07L]